VEVISQRISPAIMTRCHVRSGRLAIRRDQPALVNRLPHLWMIGTIR